MPVAMESLPPRAAELTSALHRTLVDILGDDLVAMWVHGGTTFSDRPDVPGDLDVCVVVADATADERDPDVWAADPMSRPFRIAHDAAALAKARDTHLDVTLVLEPDVRRGGAVSRAYWAAGVDTGWPVLCAHLLSGQYVHVVGPDPDEVLTPPSADEMHYALDREVDHLERHVHEGDNEDPYEAVYAMFNGCRVLYTLRTGSPVISKRSAGAWGLAELPARWHAAIEAAGRSYDGVASDDDIAVLRDTMPPFVAWVREQLPASQDRPLGPPRWS